MKFSASTPRCIESSRQGFAVVIALSLMAFVLLLLLSITTLVQVETQGSSIQMDQLEAEQAALLSLNVAIGKLQETAGLDQRVTAPAEAVDGVNGARQVTGVWRSWEGRDHKASGFPIAPDYGSKLSTGDQEIDVGSSGAGRFLSWLVSTAYDDSITPVGSLSANSPPNINEVAGRTVPLLGKASVGVDDAAYARENEVHLEPTTLADGSLSYAWWVSGENTKSLLRDSPAATGVLDWTERLSSSTRPEVNVFDISNPSDLDKASTRTNLNLVSNRAANALSVAQEYFHDLTTYSRGLLTNTATGGWRRDLSLLSEQWTDVSASDFSPLNGLPLFTLEPGVQTEARKGGEDPADAGALIYPWAIESSFDTSSVAGANSSKGAASVSWNSIVNFANQYKDIVSGSANGIVVMPGTTNGIDEDVFRRDEIPRQLVLARVHWIFSFFSKEDENDPSKLIPYLKASPVLTFWNPYNVAIERATDNRLIQGNLGTLLPYRFKFSVGGSALSTDFKPLTDFFVGGGRKELWFVVNDDGNRIWKPGESRIYSIRDRGADRLASGKSAQFELGYRTTRGFEWPLTTTGYGRSGDPSTSLSFTVETDRNTEVAFEMKNTNQNTYLRSLSDIDPTILSDYWDDLTITNTNQTLSSVENSPEPFLVAIMQLRTPSDRSTDSMGYAQAKPIISFASNRTTDGAALQNPEAFPLDWVFETPSNSGDVDMLPQFGDANSSLIGTSFRAADGLTRLIVAELPTKPLRSIGELQHFDINANNPRPPYTANPIGNSLASYLVRPNAVAINGAAADSVEVSLDHSYLSNHLLFDDWFVSSIAPETNPFQSSEMRTLRKVYEDFVSGKEELPNAAYLPVEELTSANAASAAKDLDDDKTAWHSVASKLEVEGMFNINSTSVEAWTALLQHARADSVPFTSIDLTSDSWSVALESGSGNPVSRTSFAGDPVAQPLDPDISALGTHSRLSDGQINALATEIVAQIRERGPFLSLSEFINRRLTTDVSLAKYGVIEAALNELASKGTSDNPFSGLQNSFNQDVVIPSGVSYPFQEAAQGNLVYGFPGWVRQADILKPIAPVLSARDDTFVVRAYGESRDPITGKKNSGAWCEAVLQRKADYVEAFNDEATVLPGKSTLASEVNERFGRRFVIVSFRWLSEDEV